MYKLYTTFEKYKNYKMINLKKKMKPVIVQYYVRKIYSNEIRGLVDFVNYIEKKYKYIFKLYLDKSYYEKFMEIIISSINK